MIAARALVEGRCKSKEILYSSIGLSFWGQVDARSGKVISNTHPLSGRTIGDKILAIPSGVGSCTGSQVLLELLLNGNGPAGIITARPDPILAISSVVASEIFDVSPIPILSLNCDNAFESIRYFDTGSIEDNRIVFDDREEVMYDAIVDNLKLEEKDVRLLKGEFGVAAKDAMTIVCACARLQGAEKLIDVSSVHIDSTIFIGEAGMKYVQHFRNVEENARVSVSTTTNSGSVDRKAWREMNIDEDFGVEAQRLGDAYVELGCEPTFTCAPYLLPSSRPKLGENVCWGESNAVVFANTVCGARTQKCGDFLDLAVAITGRAPYVSTHIEENRRASIVLNVPERIVQDAKHDDAFYAMLGYLAGRESKGKIPLVFGLDVKCVSEDRLKSFCAAFGTSGSVSMCHIDGVTPESFSQPQCDESVTITDEMFRDVWCTFNSNDDDDDRVDLVALGNPHFSLTELETLGELCEHKHVHKDVSFVVTTAREILDATPDHTLTSLKDFGVKFVTDTCWCMLSEPVIPMEPSSVVMTNSAKYAHYGPGLVNRRFRFGNLSSCVDVGITGSFERDLPDWI
eukprot:g5019.t1